MSCVHVLCACVCAYMCTCVSVCLYVSVCSSVSTHCQVMEAARKVKEVESTSEDCSEELIQFEVGSCSHTRTHACMHTHTHIHVYTSWVHLALTRALGSFVGQETVIGWAGQAHA